MDQFCSCRLRGVLAMTVTVELTPEQDELVRTCVASRRYENAEAVVATALRVFAAVEVE
jgi:Arc/MetJ-type ribon-helix-helix transcriptional regulator